MSIEALDWSELWRQARTQRTWKAKSKDDWNRRAAGFAKRNILSPYVKEFCSRLTLDPEMTILDVGSGPGTLSLYLAKFVKKVTALDFSPEMLEILDQRAVEQKIANIETICCAWEDDWEQLGVQPHDLVIASRSLAVDDLQPALQKANDYAQKSVVLVDRVGNGPFNPELFRAVGREFTAGPDYIYSVNILYQMGIHASVDYIEIAGQSSFESQQAIVDSCKWMLDTMTPEEESLFEDYMKENTCEQADGSWHFLKQTHSKWAVIEWNK